MVASIGYLPYGPANYYAFGPTGYGHALAKTFDHAYRPTGVTSMPLYLQYTLDAVGNPVALTDEASHHATPVESYQYDPLYRLQQVDDATGAPWQSYIYDKTGDRLTKATAGIGTDSYQYQSDTHRLIDITGATPSARAMDANGNTTTFQANGWTYALGYGDDDRLALVQQSGSANTTAYTINGRGERAVKTATTYTVIRPPVCTDPPPVQPHAANSCPPIQLKSVASEEFNYNRAGNLLSENTGGASRDYVWAGNTLVAVLDTPAQGGDTLHYVYTDGLGTPRAITTPDGTEVWDWPAVQNPFGERAASGNEYTFNLRFPGQYFDAETGLHYNFFRDYESNTGRYVESDPSGLNGGINTYGYVNQTPLTEADFFGLWVKLCSRWIFTKISTSHKNLFRYDYLLVSGTSYGFGSQGFSRKGHIFVGDESEEPSCTMICKDPKFDQYVIKAVNDIGAPTYCALGITGQVAGGINCQEWARLVLQQAKQEYLYANSKCQECFK